MIRLLVLENDNVYFNVNFGHRPTTHVMRHYMYKILSTPSAEAAQHLKLSGFWVSSVCHAIELNFMFHDKRVISLSIFRD